MMTFWQDIRHGLRVWSKNPGFTAIVVATLTLGIGATTAMFSILREALIKPLPYKDAGRLVLVNTTFNGSINPWSSFPDYYDLRDQASCFESLAATALMAQKTILTGGERPEFVNAMLVSFDLPGTLGVTPTAGRWFSAEEGKTGAPYVALVSERLARRRFGGAQQALGRGLPLANFNGASISATVVGVMPASFRFMDDADIWSPMRRGENDGPATRGFHNWLLVGRLKPEATLVRAQREADVVSERLRNQYRDTNLEKGFLVEPMQSGLFRDQTPTLVMLMVAVGLLLLIACANVAGLLLARGTLRGQELAIRAALGGSRSRIVRQLLTESLVPALLSAAGGVALAFWLQRLLPITTGLARQGIAPQRLEWPVLLFALCLALLTGLLAELVPAFRASSTAPSHSLVHGVRSTATRGSLRLRAALVVSQIAVSLILLVGAGLLLRSFARLAATNPGFEIQHLVTGEIQLPNSAYPPDRRFQFFEQLRHEFGRIPGVTGVGFIDRMPIRNRYGNYPIWAMGHPPADPSLETSANLRLMLPGYFKALGIPLLAGRDIDEFDHAGSHRVMVVSERMAKTLFPDGSAVGQQVVAVLGPLVSKDPVVFEVVGVVANARIDGVDAPSRMTMYASYDQVPPQRATMGVALRTALAPETVTAAVRRIVQARHPDVPVDDLLRMEQLIGDSLAPQRVTAVTLALFAGVAMLLAVIGLYGMLAYWVSQRMHELGIRLALGAQRRDILRLILGQGMTLAAGGAGAGIAASLALTRLMQHMMYEIAPDDPATFAGVTLILTLTAAIACYLPARHATRVDPTQTLRAE